MFVGAVGCFEEAVFVVSFEKAGVFDKAQIYYTKAAEHARTMGNDQQADDIQYYARTLPDEIRG